MDEQKVREAIEYLKASIEADEEVQKGIKDEEIIKISRTFISYEKTAIEALEKQLPMKPAKVVGAKFIELAECKNCGNELDSELSLGEYCLWCGQRIDWSEQS